MAKNPENVGEITNETKNQKCGIIMPISPNPDYPLDHWKDVLNIITESINETQFKPNLVSDDEAIGLIHERIVTNIYSNEMIVCDVSSKNPNVMFELGLRLAFDKPVIIIRDDKTSYTFDTGVIEHITYPSSLRFGDIVIFKKDLARRLDATYKKSLEPDYSPFLKGFGKTIIPSKLGKEEISETNFLIEQMNRLRDEMKQMRYEARNQNVGIYNDKRFLRNNNSYKNMIKLYFEDILDKNGRISLDELCECTIRNFKDKFPELAEQDIIRMVSDFYEKP